MKILIVIDYLGSGGAQIQKAYLAKGLNDLGHKVDFYTYFSKERDDLIVTKIKSLGISIYNSSKIRDGFSLKIMKELRQILSINNYDAVISSMHTPSIYSALAMIGRHKTKLIVCEESSSHAPTPKLRKVLFYFSCLVADCIVTNSFNETKLLGRLPLLSNKISTIWNGFEIPHHKKNKHIVQNKILKLLVVARVAYPKNGLNLLKALSLFHQRNGWVPDLEWAGRRDTDSKSLEMQKQMDLFLLDNPKIASSWTWLGEVKDVTKLYRKSDAMILVSIYEGFANTLSEAMIEECFVIASKVSDNEIVIGNDERGLLCNPLSPQSICNSIEHLNDMSYEKKVKMVKNARNYVELNFNINNLTKSFVSLIAK